MHELPEDFANTVARVIEPDDRESVARIIEAAALLDDDGLRRFLDMFASRVRASAAPVRYEELRGFLRAAAQGGLAAAP
jgi:hypothetical protein